MFINSRESAEEFSEISRQILAFFLFFFQCYCLWYFRDKEFFYKLLKTIEIIKGCFIDFIEWIIYGISC